MSFLKRLDKEQITGLSFLTPAIVLICLFVVGPMLMAFSYGFTDYHLLRPHAKEFIGLENFRYMLEDTLMFKAFKNTTLFVALVVPLQLSMALGFALIINKNFKGNLLPKLAFFSPSVLSLVVISILWSILLNPNSGLLNQIIDFLGFEKQPFLYSTTQAIPTIAFISAWSCCGYQMLIFLSGLKNIPAELYEAAKIDGATKFQSFIYITLPGLKPITVFLVVTTIIGAFKLIVQPMVMTGGGPDNSTLTILQYIYEYGFRHRNTGYSSAVTIVFVTMLIGLSLLFKKFIHEEE